MKKISFLSALFFWSITAFAQTPSISASETTVCLGEAVRLTATGCNTQVVWSNGKQGNTLLVENFQETTTYTASCMEGERIVFNYAQTIKVTAVEKPQTPYLFCNADIIKKGESASVKTFGCDGTVTWSNGTVGREITVSPDKTTTYTAVCQNAAGCSAEPISRTIIVKGDEYGNPTPTISWRYGCENENVVMTANGCTAGVYVWYQHTLYQNNIVRSDEIGRGNSVEVNKGGESIFYTARCQFQDCLGDESNRLFIGFTKNINAPTVSKELLIDSNNPVAVDLNSALGKASTSGGIYIFRKEASLTSDAIATPKAILAAGSYYVAEQSREGKCVSGFSKIIVKTTTNPQEIIDNQAIAIKETVIDAPSSSTQTNIQGTDTGAIIGSIEPNAEFPDLKIAEGFSPNGDGANDTFEVKELGTRKASLNVYNRYGHLVFEAQEYKNDWDGTANTGSAKNSKLGLPDGTYYYVLKLEDGRQKISFLTLMR